MSAAGEQDKTNKQPTGQTSSNPRLAPRSSMEVDRGSVRQDNDPDRGLKPASKGPEDLSYSINRWLQQPPLDETWRYAKRE